MMKVNNEDTKARTMSVFIANFNQISHIILVFALLFEQVTASWVITICFIFLKLVIQLDRHLHCSEVFDIILSKQYTLLSCLYA